MEFRGLGIGLERTLLLALIGVLLAGAAGCGGGTRAVIAEPRKSVDDDEPTVASAQAAKQTAANTAIKGPPAAKQPVKAPPPAGSRAEAINVVSREAMTGGPPNEANRRPTRAPRKAEEEPVSPRPADLSHWGPDDFRSALADRDPRLLQAVQHLAGAQGDVDANARLLIEVLDESSSGTAALQNRALPQAIVTALGANRSEIARNALKEILLGKRTSAIDDRRFTIAALAALVENAGPEADALAFAVLTVPDAIRPPGRSSFAGEALQRECAALVRNSASPQLRLRLAQYAANPTTPAAHTKLLLPMLMETRSDNLRAQTELALADGVDATQRTALQRQLLTQARRAIDSLMGVPETAQLNSDDEPAPRSTKSARDPEQVEATRRAADDLCNPDFVDRLAQRLASAAGPREAPDLFGLATSLPCDALRTVVRKQLSDAWTDGDAIVRTAPFSPALMRDPGMLLVLKSLPREDAAARAWADKSRGNSPQQQRLAQERKAKAAWTNAAETMATTLMRRFDAASQAALVARRSLSAAQTQQPLESIEDLDRLVSNRKPSPPGDDPKETSSNETSSAADAAPPADALPIELPQGAQIDAVFRLQWPEQLERRVTSLPGPLSVCYVRARVEDQPQHAVAGFSRQLPGARDRAIENGRWLDSASRPTAGKVRSVDVRIRSKAPGSLTPVSNRGRAAELVVEILWIEIGDFMAEPASPKT